MSPRSSGLPECSGPMTRVGCARESARVGRYALYVTVFGGPTGSGGLWGLVVRSVASS